MDLVVVFHLPPPGGRIQAGKLVLLEKDPTSGGRACAELLEKVCAGAPDRPLGAAYYEQTASDSVGVPSGTMHFGQLLAILFHRRGRHHHIRADPAWLHRMPGHGGDHGDFWGDNSFSPIHQEERRLPRGLA
jgi:hypothetical protein